MNTTLQTRLPETEDGTTLFNVPFSKDLAALKDMAPIIMKQPYQIDYIHSYGQDSPWFAALANGVLLASRCQSCKSTFATPRSRCMECGGATEWVELPKNGKLHTFTVCHFGAEAFLPECPFVLGLIEFKEADTLLLTRVLGLDPANASLDWIGMNVEAKFRRNSKLNPTDVYFVPSK